MPTTPHSGIYYEIHGDGIPLLLGFPIMASFQEIFGTDIENVAKQYIEKLSDRYAVLLMDYPSIGKSSNIPTSDLTIGRVTEDYLSVLDHAGFDRFVYWGYSWGAAVGLQLAAQIPKRLLALIVGGWPPLGAQYEDILKAAKDQVHAPPKEVQVVLRSPAQYAQWVTFWQSMQNYSEEEALRLITCPQLAFAGGNGDTTAGKEKISNATILRTHKTALEALGWQVELIDGHGHEVGLKPDVTVPVVRRFLDRTI